MAVIKQGILGGFSGSVGSVVGASWKGISVMKSKPVSVANPKTAGQVEQRSNFSGVVAMAQTILSVFIKPLWDRFASKMSGYNDFVSTNIAYFTAGLLTNPGALITSKGKMAVTNMLTAVADESASTIALTWANDSGSGFKLATDKAYVVAFCEDGEVIKAWATNVPRSALTLTVTGATMVSLGTPVHVYVSFLRADGTVVSNNSYNLVNPVA